MSSSLSSRHGGKTNSIDFPSLVFRRMLDREFVQNSTQEPCSFFSKRFLWVVHLCYSNDTITAWKTPVLFYQRDQTCISNCNISLCHVLFSYQLVIRFLNKTYRIFSSKKQIHENERTRILSHKKVFLLYISCNERPFTFGYAGQQKYFFNIQWQRENFQKLTCSFKTSIIQYNQCNAVKNNLV